MIAAFLGKTYGCLLLFDSGILDCNDWYVVDYSVSCAMFIYFTFLLKNMVNNLVYSISMTIFASRLITEVFYDGMERWYELPLIIVCTIIFYFIQRIKWTN